MKILMVTMGLEIGGAETHIVELCRALREMGNDITVASNGGVYVAELAKYGITHVSLPLHTKKPNAIIRSYRGLYKLISEGDFDIVHAHARIPAFICALVRRRLDFRFTTTAHLDFKVNAVLRTVTRWGEKTLAVSEDIKQYLIKNYGVKADNIALTINGIDSAKFSPDTDYSDIVREFSLDESAKHIVYISRLDRDRSLVAYHLIDIAEELCSVDGKLEIVIVGGGGDFAELKEKAEKVNEKLARRAVIMTGARTDINKFAALSDIFVAVSRSALEAMSCEKPVIVAGNQGYLGIFDESKLKIGIDTNFCCRGCPDANKDMLKADVLSLLKAAPEELDAMGSYNRSVVIENYSVRRMANDYLALYESLPRYADFKYADVVLSGYYGFDNMGDDSLLGAISENLIEASPKLKIAALTKKPREMTERAGIRCINRVNYFEIRRQFRHAKLLISGGGTLIQDSTSSKSLFYYCFIMRLAKKLGAKLYIYANGAGPLYRNSSKKLAAKTAMLADRITVREPDAKNTLVSLGIPENRITVTADPAFMIRPIGSPEEISAKVGLESGERYFAVSLRECTGKMAKQYDPEQFIDKITKICRDVREKYGMTPVFIPMQPRHDTEVCTRVRDAVGFGTVVEGLRAGELCSLIRGMDFVLGMRLHMLVFASHMCVPMIGMSYDPKINGLMNYLGQSKLFAIQDFSCGDVLAAIDDTVANSDGIRRALEASVSGLTELAKSDVAAAAGMARE